MRYYCYQWQYYYSAVVVPLLILAIITLISARISNHRHPVVQLCSDERTHPLEFLERLEELSLLYGISEDKLSPGISVVLRDNALLWYRNNRDNLQNGTNLKQSLSISIYWLIIKYGWKKKPNKIMCSDYVTALQTLVTRVSTIDAERRLYWPLKTFN